MTDGAERDARRRELLGRYGPLIGSQELRMALGYSSAGAFRQALSKGRLPIRVFSLDGRRGKFAWTADLAEWLDHVEAAQ